MNKSFAAFVVATVIAASAALPTATKAATPESVLAPIMGKTCAGTIGSETPVRIFFTPYMNGSIVYMRWGGDFINGRSDRANAMKPWADLKLKDTPVTDIGPGGGVMVRGYTVYEMHVRGQNLFGRGQQTGGHMFVYHFDGPCE